MIVKKLKTMGMEIDTVPEAMESLIRDGYDRVVIQPTHVINGEEFDKLCRMSAPYAQRITVSMGQPLLTSVQDYRALCGAMMEEFDKLCRMSAPYAQRITVSMGQPLLTSVQDYRALCGAMMESIPAPAEDEALLFMGHGSAHYANAAYALLEYMLHDLGWERALIATVEGYPELPQAIARLRRMSAVRRYANAAYALLEYMLHDLGWERALIATVEGYPELPQAIARLRRMSAVRRVRLHPLMVVAGDHAKNDMAGQSSDSWKNVLEGEGYQTECVLRGMGEYPAVRQLFGIHARQASEQIG